MKMQAVLQSVWSVMNGRISQDVIITLSTVPGGSATGGIIALRSTCFFNSYTRVMVSPQSDAMTTIF